MTIQNTDIADILSRMADLLEIQGANRYRVGAYRNAAHTIAGLPRPITQTENGALTDLPGIGIDLSEKIIEIVSTGSLSQLDELEKAISPGLSALMKIEGIGPKRVKTLYQKLAIQSREELKHAAKSGKIRRLEGFGKKTEQSILEAISRQNRRTRLFEVEAVAADMVAYLKKAEGIKKVTVAGSYRRRMETIGDLDILITCRRPQDVMDHFVAHEDVRKIISKGKTRSTVILRSGLQVDLLVSTEAAFGAALHYWTGSKAHHVAVRRRGVERNLKINQYGVFKAGKKVAGKTEQEIYAQVDLPYIPPELREGGAELSAAVAGRLPELLDIKSIRGDLHAHTRATDGRSGLEEMVMAARDKGYAYIAITEHSQRVSIAGGFDARRLAEQIERIDRLNDSMDDFVVLKGIEVDILEDGRLDLPDDILSRLDVRICSIHYNQKLSADKQTERILRAMDNPYFNILGHPTGRLINGRRPIELDMQRIMEGALARGCFLELNSNPERLDLDDRYCRMAKQIGLKVAISTDAHSTLDLESMRFGVDQARRGWLESADVLNTRPLAQLLDKFRRK